MRTWPALEVDGGTGWLDDELLQAALVGLDVSAVEELPGSWRIFFASAAARDAAIPILTTAFPDSTLTPVDVLDEDWAARSQASLKAIQVGDIIVAPPWDIPSVRADLKVGPYIVIIQPSMGFGTGHHATTRLCLAALQQVDLRGKSVIDVGTGSGVLAIAASLRGAREVVGVDIDPDALESARDNLALNPAARVTLGSEWGQSVLRPLNGATQGFDMALGNLTGALLIQSAPQLRALAPVLVLSGFQTHEEADVLAAFPDRTVAGRAEEEGWVCVRLS